MYLSYKEVRKTQEYQQRKEHGAGIIPIFKVQGERDTKLATVLFRNKKGCYCFGGGRKDPEDRDLRHAACREMQEESLNVFRFKPEQLNQAHFMYAKMLQKRNQNKIFGCFIVGISGITSESITSKYIANKHKIQKAHRKSFKNREFGEIPSCWRETDDVQIFYLSDLKKCKLSDSNRLYPKDIEGNLQKLSKRTSFFIKKLAKHLF